MSIFNRYTAVAVSVALHGAAIAAIAARPAVAHDPVAAPQATIEITAAPSPAPEPMIVALLDDHSVVAPATVPGSAPVRIAATTSNHAIASKVEPSSVVTPTGPVEHNPLMTMRHPDQQGIEKGVSEGFTARFLQNTRPLQPKDNPTEQMQDELATADSYLRNPRWVANATPDQLTAMRLGAASMRDELANRELQPDGTGRKAEHRAFTMRVAADGSARIHDNANVQRQGLGLSFDVTDAMMRRHGIDPYSSYKLKVLDETRDERAAMGMQHRTQQLAQSKQFMHKNLERLWATTADLAARKQGLFELWDDCAESGSEELVTGGYSAREYVVGFIRSKLPPGTELAFSANELARYNRQRKSQATFAPYL